MKDKMLTALLVTAAVMLAACGSQSATNQSAPPTPQPAGMITEFRLPTGVTGSNGITAGPDGNLWFTESAMNSTGQFTASKIGRITPAGQITEFPLSTPSSDPGDITSGPDGNLWFTVGGSQIGRITPVGQITEFPLSTPSSHPSGITTGPDGNLWFTESALNRSTGQFTASKIGRITPAGQITEFPLSTPSSDPGDITSGPDGNLWFIEPFDSQIGRITPAGQITEFSVPATDSDFGVDFGSITTGPDGNLWLTESSGSIGRMTPLGQTTAFPLPTPNRALGDITAGPDGNLWFTERNIYQNGASIGGNRIGRMTPLGQITEFPLPTPSDPTLITAGPDGNLWFIESNKIGRITSGK